MAELAESHTSPTDDGEPKPQSDVAESAAIEKLAKLASKFSSLGLYADALELLDTAIQIAPDNLAVSLERAKVLERKKNEHEQHLQRLQREKDTNKETEG